MVDNLLMGQEMSFRRNSFSSDARHLHVVNMMKQLKKNVHF